MRFRSTMLKIYHFRMMAPKMRKTAGLFRVISLVGQGAKLTKSATLGFRMLSGDKGARCLYLFLYRCRQIRRVRYETLLLSAQIKNVCAKNVCVWDHFGSAGSISGRRGLQKPSIRARPRVLKQDFNQIGQPSSGAQSGNSIRAA